jgi:UDP-N-acetylmuramoyl-L-alanyl-D-glutamate--2,6-diaminopimelate ligase
MLGRFKLQKLLRQMVDEGCRYAVIETSSEGILQYRHKGIDYSVAVFTNLSPEHIERHGTFENYRAAKLKLCQAVAKKRDGIGIYNLDDASVDYFLACDIYNKIGFGTRNKYQLERFYKISDINLFQDKTEFSINNERFQMPLIGEFNVYNAAAAICVAQSQGISTNKIKEILENAKPTPGRLEVIKGDQPFTVIVDYAHEPASLEAAYRAIKVFNPKKIIALLGAQGGGRDKAKRPELGRIAGQYADTIIVTNEDPYDENPQQIIDDIKQGITPRLRSGQNLFEILDRREAIKKALNLAEAGDIVILTGKGGEVWMCGPNGEKIPWNEREIVEEGLKKLNLT